VTRELIVLRMLTPVADEAWMRVRRSSKGATQKHAAVLAAVPDTMGASAPSLWLQLSSRVSYRGI
jgi:hypothetical protein